MADPSATSVVIPALNEEARPSPRSSRPLAARARWREIIVVDDGSTDDTAPRAAAAGARVIRHPYNKGNGAAVKTGIRNATGDYVLIVDGDGQHRPDDALRLVGRLGEYDLVVGARSAPRRRRRRGAAATLSSTGSPLSHRAAHSRSDVGLPRRAARLPAASSCTCCRTASRRRRRRRWRSSGPATTSRSSRSRRASGGQSKIRLARDGAQFFLILLKVITSSARCACSCRSAPRRSRSAPSTASGHVLSRRGFPTARCCC